MRLIDSDALIATLHNVTFEDGTDREIVYRCVELTPTIEGRKTGKWVIRGGIHNMYTSYACSECGREIEMYYDFGNIPTDADVINEFPYCHCGAKMEADK